MNRKINFSIPESDENDTSDDRPGSEPRIIPIDGHETRENLPGQSSEQKKRSILGGTTGARLAMLSLMLVMVIFAMNHASKPESWNWLFKFDKVDLEHDQPQGNASDELSNSIADSDKPPGSSETAPSLIENKPTENKSNVTRKGTGEYREQEFWKRALKQMDGQQQLRLFNLVDATTKQSALKSGSTASLRPVMAGLKSLRKKFAAEPSLKESPQDAERFAATWNQSLVPAFEAVLNEQPNKALLDETVQSLADVLQLASNELIVDKTPVNRVHEAYAWFAGWSEVYDQSVGQQIEQTATVTQLISQPDAWRGKTIRVTGTALRVERVEASHNALGIDRYYVIWIKPDHPSSFPYCVYTLMAPESLMGEPNEKMREVKQRVQTNARFFKNRLFDAGEAAVAPVLMTTSVEIPPAVVKADKEKFQIPGRNIVLLTIGIVGGMATLIAFTVYRTTLSGRVRALPKTERLQGEFSKLQHDERVETTVEKLKRLGRDAHDSNDEYQSADSDSVESDS